MLLRYNDDDGLYIGARLTVTGAAMLRRIRALTKEYVGAGADETEAAETAWQTALEETTWQLGDDGVSPTSRTVRNP